jgi:urease accessory protein
VSFAPGAGVVEVAPGGCVTRLAATSPLQLLTPRNHGRAAWVFASNHGGGLVDGDCLRLDVRVAAGGAAYLTTQASTKVYRGAAAQELDAVVERDGLLVSLPDPVVCFAGAAYRQRSLCRLAEGASLVWLESLSAGRVENGERWAFARYQSSLRVERDGRPAIVDGLLLDPQHGALESRLGRFAALATLVATGPAVRALREQWLAPTELSRRAPVLIAPSPIGDDAVVVRMAAESMLALGNVLRSLLAPLVPLLGDDPFARKW